MHYSNNNSNSNGGTAAAAGLGAAKVASADLVKELEDMKDKLKVMTTKFATARKERDQLKTENKELQDEVI